MPYGKGDHLLDIRKLAPLTASEQPKRLGPNIPGDLSSIKRASVAIIVRRSGDPYEQEVLLIKRSQRAIDRWSGHIALPGGRQDPGENDLETCYRETLEEVGLDLAETADYLGPLEPRIIRISWGRKVAMILCPFVFSLKDKYKESILIPQETEVAAAFWHSLHALYAHEFRTTEEISVGDRINLPWGLNALVSWQTGNMLFDAVEISPSLSESSLQQLPPIPWKVWGITWALLQELRMMLDPDFSICDITLPTFKAWDIRTLLQVLTWSSIRRKKALYSEKQADWTNKLLDGYFAYFPVAIGTGIATRIGAVAVVTRLIIRSNL